DFHVTGVQTCALPICSGMLAMGIFALSAGSLTVLGALRAARAPITRGTRTLFGTWSGRFIETNDRTPEIDQSFALTQIAPEALRSEERRVGKECRSRW